MEAAFKVLAHSGVAALLDSLDRVVKQRLMHVTPIPVIIVQLVTACQLVMSVHVLLAILVMIVTRESTTVSTLHAIMVVLAPTAWQEHVVLVCQDLKGFVVRSISMNASPILAVMEVDVRIK